MNLPTYSLRPPENHKLKKELFGHAVYSLKKKQCLVPLAFSKKSINPINFYNIKTELKIKEVCILDRLMFSRKKVCIANHVNRSGFNFLIGNTPIDDLPQFPDVSNIYHLDSSLDAVVVHTVGPKRFPLVNDGSLIISEAVGLIGPLWHYVGVRVFALGIPS